MLRLGLGSPHVHVLAARFAAFSESSSSGLAPLLVASSAGNPCSTRSSDSMMAAASARLPRAARSHAKAQGMKPLRRARLPARRRALAKHRRAFEEREVVIDQTGSGPTVGGKEMPVGPERQLIGGADLLEQ